MNIVVFGASDKTGTQIVMQALEEGHLVTAFVRNALKLSVKHDNLNTILKRLDAKS